MVFEALRCVGGNSPRLHALVLLEHALLLRVAVASLEGRRRIHLRVGLVAAVAGAEAREVLGRVAVLAALLEVAHEDEGDDDEDPVEVVGEDGADGGGVGPAQEGVEDAPAAAAVELRVAAVDVPDALADVVGAGARADLGGVTADDMVPGVDLKVPDGLGEETGGYEVEEAGGDDEEELQGRGVASSERERDGSEKKMPPEMMGLSTRLTCR